MIDFAQIFSGSTVQFALVALVLYTVYGAIWRLYLSPIASFPGPKLAALTLWYPFFYDVFPYEGQYTFKIRELHEKYGPIVRVTPWELHINDPEYYDTVHSSKEKRDKWKETVKIFGDGGDIFATRDHNLHRMRRAAFATYFSVANVRRLQPVLNEKVGMVIQRLRGLARTGEVVRCVAITSAFSTDVIMEYAFGRSYNRLEAANFSVDEFDRVHAMASGAWVVQHFYFIMIIMQSLPTFIAVRMGGAFADLAKVTADFEKQVKETIMEQKVEQQQGPAHRTIFHELLNSDLPIEEKSTDRLANEARGIVAAAGETIAWAMAVITFHLLTNPDVLRKLKLELQHAIPDPDAGLAQAQLENLPYLRGVIKEGVRLGYGLSTRLQRVPHEPLIYKTADREWTIPAWTPVGLTSVFIHHDESIYPDSYAFKPERWIENPKLDRYLVSFSKGSRQCLGMNLAYAEMFLYISSVFRRFGSKEVRFEQDEGIFELVDTDITDVRLARDFFVPEVKKGSKGIRIRVLP